MKSGSSKAIKPNSAAIDVLVSYQAYCISAGCTDKSFREVLISKTGFKSVRRYQETLNNYINGKSDIPLRDMIIKVVGTFPVVRTREHFAYAFIVLNAYLRKCYDEACILSSYDLQEVIRRLSGCKEGIQQVSGGSITYSDNTDMYTITIDRIITKSIYKVSDALKWVSTDCPLKDIVGWLLSDWFEYEDDYVAPSYRGLPPALWNRHHDYICDTIDNAQLIQNSLPMFGVPAERTCCDEVSKSIANFVWSTNSDCFHGSHVRLACTDNERGIIFNGIYAHVRRSHVDENMLLMNIATAKESYLLSIRKEYLKSYRGLFKSYRQDVYRFGDTLNMNIGSGSNNVLDYVVEQFDKGFLELFMNIVGEERQDEYIGGEAV